MFGAILYAKRPDVHKFLTVERLTCNHLATSLHPSQFFRISRLSSFSFILLDNYYLANYGTHQIRPNKQEPKETNIVWVDDQKREE